MTTNTLDIYGLSQGYIDLADLPLELADQLTESYEDLAPQLDQLAAANTADKVLALAKVVQQLEAEAAMLEERIEMLAARAQARTGRAANLKRYMQLQLEAWQLQRAKDAYVSVWLQKNAPSVEVLDLEQVPDAYKRATWSGPASMLTPEQRETAQVDVARSNVLAAVKETGEVVPGVRIVTDRQHLRIR